ncbi:MAG: glycosyltransferase family 39 protein [Bacteroidales bacterium]|nr:glycosyltransferase family 39 protein [Bacteroidales bacterium]
MNLRSPSPVLSRVSAWMLVGGLFLLLTGGQLLTHGMFLDGVLYGTTARNLSEGFGSVWHLNVTPAFCVNLCQPPLAIGLQSLLFTLLGDHFWVERVGSTLALVATGGLMGWTWTRAGQPRDMAWLPALLLLAVSGTAWAANNNVLENTMTLFVLGSVLCMLQARHGQRWLWLGMAGVLLWCAFLSKGPMGLFPLALPTLYACVCRGEERPWPSLLRGVGHSAATLLGLMVAAGLTCLLWSEAAEALRDYVLRQTEASLRPGDEPRYIILWKFFEHTLPLLLLTLVVWFATRRKCRRDASQVAEAGVAATETTRRWMRLLALLVACGVLPVMLSRKQHAYYLLSVYPFCALLAALVCRPAVESLWDKGRRWVTPLAAVALVGGIGLTAGRAGQASRDRLLLDDMERVCAQVGEGACVGVPRTMLKQATFVTYCYRYHHVTLDAYRGHDFLLVPRAEADDARWGEEGYVRCSTDAHGFQLYHKEQKISQNENIV